MLENNYEKLKQIISLIKQDKIYGENETITLLNDYLDGTRLTQEEGKLLDEFTDAVIMLDKKYFLSLIKLLREKLTLKGKNDYFGFNTEEAYLNYLIKDKKFEEALKYSEEIIQHYETSSFNNETINIKNRMLDIQNLLGIKEDILLSVEKERYKVVEIITIFVAIIGFLFSNITILTNIQSFEVGKQYLILLSITLFTFPIVWYFINADWKDKNNQLKLVSLLFILIIMILYLLF